MWVPTEEKAYKNECMIEIDDSMWIPKRALNQIGHKNHVTSNCDFKLDRKKNRLVY